MRCGNCGALIKEGERKCLNCGVKLNGIHNKMIVFIVLGFVLLFVLFAIFYFNDFSISNKEKVSSDFIGTYKYYDYRESGGFTDDYKVVLKENGQCYIDLSRTKIDTYTNGQTRRWYVFKRLSGDYCEYEYDTLKDKINIKYDDEYSSNERKVLKLIITDDNNLIYEDRILERE